MHLQSAHVQFAQSHGQVSQVVERALFSVASCSEVIYSGKDSYPKETRQKEGQTKISGEMKVSTKLFRVFIN